jgi:hypothetical protein
MSAKIYQFPRQRIPRNAYAWHLMGGKDCMDLPDVVRSGAYEIQLVVIVGCIPATEWPDIPVVRG